MEGEKEENAAEKVYACETIAEGVDNLTITAPAEPIGASPGEPTASSILMNKLMTFTTFKNEMVPTCDNLVEYNVRIDERIKDEMVIFDKYKEKAYAEGAKILYWRCRGLILSSSTKYTGEGIYALARVVKLDPTLVDVWNTLGEMYSAQHEYALSKKCFLSALEQSENVTSLQNLSILTRLKKGATDQDLQEGLELANKALALDSKNATSLVVAGNAYMSLYFQCNPCDNYLSKAEAYYRRAKAINDGDSNMARNLFQLLRFNEKFEEALKLLAPTHTSNKLDWKELRCHYNGLLEYLKEVQDLFNKKGKLRPKKLEKFLKDLEKYTTPLIPAVKDLYVVGVIIWILSPDDGYPYTLGIINETGIHVITIFNMSRTKGFNVGDTIELPNTRFTKVNFSINNNDFVFTKYRVNSPIELVINGRTLKIIHCSRFIVNFES